MLTAPALAELHVHLYGCIRPAQLLAHLAAADNVLWDWYEGEVEAAYGAVPPVRELVEKFRRGEPDAVRDFERALSGCIRRRRSAVSPSM